MHGNSVSSLWQQMLADERRIMRKNLLAGGWALRHPISARNAIDAQLDREVFASAAAGDARRAWIFACLSTLSTPIRRWRWMQARQLFSDAFFQTRAVEG
jgi:hypothetical protein